MISAPFPDDVPVAPLPKLSFMKLAANDAVEISRLLEASVEHGFFLLHLAETDEGRQLLHDVDEAFEIGKRFFAEGLDTKKTFKVDSGNVGYKPMGVMKFADGKTDLTEICAVSRDSIMDVSRTNIPRAFLERRAFLQDLIQRLHPIAMLLLQALGRHLEVSPTLMHQYHNFNEPSATVLRFLHNPPQSSLAEAERQASLLGHTDSGSVTILFPTVGGLQVLPNNMEEDAHDGWLWVKPEPGYAVVNLGDPMVQWTGGILRSAFHRVLYAPGAQADEERYSFGYFLKPADLAPMQRIQEGSIIPKHTADDPEVHLPHYDLWHQNKTRKILTGSNGNVSRGGTAFLTGSAGVVV